MKWRWLLVVVAIIGVWQFWSDSEVSQPDGVLVEGQPKQVNLPQKKTLTKGEFTVTPQAYFDIKARVLSRKNYFLGREADLSPVDLALGWKKMSDQRVLEKIKISQSNRFYFWKVKEFPIPKKEIIRSSANMHMIPANSDIEARLSGIRKGHIIRIRGFLVNIDASDGWKWRTSMSRDDSGNGACELVWVEEIEILG